MAFRSLRSTLLILALVPSVAIAGEATRTLDNEQWLSYPAGLTGAADPLRFLIESTQEILRLREDPPTLADWQARAPGLRRALAQSLGLDPMPDRCPLNARITGRSERDSYTIENVVFESRPGFLVSANVYLPRDVSLPAPAVVVAAGHSMEHGKNHDLYQLAQLGLVKQGMIVLAFDPIGQGERKLPGFAHDLGYGSLLVGQTNEGRIVWDAIRSVDYLVSRVDVDAEHIGLAGNSGGGELVFYAMPLDDRIRTGASFCFVCSYDRWIDEGGSHCICNHLPGITREMEQFEIIGLNAPRAFLAGNGAEDKIFPIDGTRETIRRARRIYDLFGAGDRIDAMEAPLPHGWSQPLREAGTAWLAHGLLGRERLEAIPESGITAEDPASEDLRAFKGGGMPEGAETVVTLNRKLATAQARRYAVPPSSREAWETRAAAWREAVWQVLGGRPQPFEPTARVVSTFEWEGLHIEVLSIAVEPGMEIGATLSTPVSEPASHEATLFVGGFETRGSALREGRAAAAARRGTVLVIDPRGTGESAKNLNQLVSGGIVMGRTLFAQQVWDLVQSSRWLANREHTSVAVHGASDGALLSVYAGALEAPFARIELEDLLASYLYYLEDEQPQSILLSVPNILAAIDIPQLIALAGPTPMRIDGTAGFGNVRMDSGASTNSMRYPLAIADLCGRSESLQIE